MNLEDMIPKSVVLGRADRIDFLADETEKDIKAHTPWWQFHRRWFFEGRVAALREHAAVLRDDVNTYKPPEPELKSTPLPDHVRSIAGIRVLPPIPTLEEHQAFIRLTEPTAARNPTEGMED